MEKYADPILVEVQANGYKGTTLPTNYQSFYPGFKFVLVTSEKCKLYEAIPSVQVDDEFDACIKIRSGKYNWIEIMYDIASKKHSYGEKIIVKDIPTYDICAVSDIYDVVNCFYKTFECNSHETDTFLCKLLSNTCTIDDVNNYLNLSIDENKFCDIYVNLKQSVRNVLYYKYTRFIC